MTPSLQNFNKCHSSAELEAEHAAHSLLICEAQLIEIWSYKCKRRNIENDFQAFEISRGIHLFIAEAMYLGRVPFCDAISSRRPRTAIPHGGTRYPAAWGPLGSSWGLKSYMCLYILLMMALYLKNAESTLRENCLAFSTPWREVWVGNKVGVGLNMGGLRQNVSFQYRLNNNINCREQVNFSRALEYAGCL